MEKHPQAELIKQVVDGLAVPQYKSGEGWQDSSLQNLIQCSNWKWRAKPAEPEKVYPVTQMSDDEMRCRCFYKDMGDVGMRDGLRRLADCALRHAVDNGYLLTPEQAKKLANESFQHGADDALARMGQEYTAEHDKNIAQAVYLAAQRILDSRMTWAIEHARKAMLAELLESLPAIVKEVQP